jgi:ribonuclease D
VTAEPEPVSAPPVIADPAEFGSLIDRLASEPTIALDTEFHRERTYFPKVALVQLAWSDGVALVDPLAVSLEPLAALFGPDNEIVFHAADQDLEVLELACGDIPDRIYDTQVAAGFLGMTSPSLAAVCDRELGVRLPKAERLTDWLARPLGERQREYAASDVLHLLEVRDRQREALRRRGRLEWAQDECDVLRTRIRGARDPQEAWRRIKEARQLRGRARCVVRSVAALLDQPPRFVLADLAVVGIAQRAPTTVDDLVGIRGVDERMARGRLGLEVLDAVAEGRNATVPSEPEPSPELERELRPAVTLVSAWVSQLARDEELDTSLLATRADIEAILRADPSARLAVGWRAELVGEPIRALVSGDAALAFNGDGTLVLEQRSRQRFARPAP